MKITKILQLFKNMIFSVPCITFVYLVCTACALTPEQEQRIENVVNEFMERNSVPGMGFSVVYDEDVFSTGYGVKNVENNLATDYQTLFGIASLTKSFTATIVVKVLNQVFPGLGTSALDHPISKLIPNYNFTMSDRYRYESLSFRDLLAHKTCMDTSTLGRTMGSISNAAEFAYRTRYIQEVCPFRTGYTHNNAMYALAGDLIAAIANSSFVDLAEDLLQQIGMTDTIIYKTSLDFEDIPNASRGYYRQNGEFVRVNSNLFKRMHVALPSGGLMASSRDISKYMQFHMNYGKINGVQIVPTAVIRRIHTPSTPLSMSGIEGDYAYGLGLRLGIYDRWQLESHTGTWPPFTSRMSLFPTLKLGIFTVVNGPGILTLNHKYIHDRVFDIVTGFNTTLSACDKYDCEEQEYTNELNENKNLNPAHSNVDLEPIDLQGLYGNPVHGELTIIYNEADPNGNLYLHFGEWGTGYLRKVTNSNSTYYPLWDSDIVGDFLSQATQVPITTLDFGIKENVVVLIFDGSTVEFVRDATLDTFPSQPWTSNSCAPDY